MRKRNAGIFDVSYLIPDTIAMYFRTEGVILSRRNFGEADRILTIYSRDFGKITCIAKGVRRPKSRKGGHVEIGNWCKVFIARGKNLDLLTEVELKKGFGIVDFSESKANKIYHLLELVNALTVEKQKNREIFILMVQFLKKISTEEDFNLLLSSFKIKLLSLLGFFSADSLPETKTKKILSYFEKEPYEVIKEKINLNKNSYLKLSSYLDTMIEKLTETQLKTAKFLKNF